MEFRYVPGTRYEYYSVAVVSVRSIFENVFTNRPRKFANFGIIARGKSAPLFPYTTRRRIRRRLPRDRCPSARFVVRNRSRARYLRFERTFVDIYRTSGSAVSITPRVSDIRFSRRYHFVYGARARAVIPMGNVRFRRNGRAATRPDKVHCTKTR